MEPLGAIGKILQETRENLIELPLSSKLKTLLAEENLNIYISKKKSKWSREDIEAVIDYLHELAPKPENILCTVDATTIWRIEQGIGGYRMNALFTYCFVIGFDLVSLFNEKSKTHGLDQR